MSEHKINLELPDPPATPDLQPQITEMREQLARLDERSMNLPDPAAAAESLRLASEAHRLASEAHERVAALESAAEHATAQVASEVLEVEPPQPIQTPELPVEEDPQTQESHEPHQAWWNPLRYI